MDPITMARDLAPFAQTLGLILSALTVWGIKTGRYSKGLEDGNRAPGDAQVRQE